MGYVPMNPRPTFLRDFSRFRKSLSRISRKKGKWKDWDTLFHKLAIETRRIVRLEDDLVAWQLHRSETAWAKLRNAECEYVTTVISPPPSPSSPPPPKVYTVQAEQLDDAQYKRIKKFMKQQYTGIENAGKLPVIEHSGTPPRFRGTQEARLPGHEDPEIVDTSDWGVKVE